MAKIGIFPGTFDPIHLGHIDFCLSAVEACGLDRVVLLPEAEPRGKASVASLEDRVSMVKLVTEADPRLELLVLRSSPFTIEKTLPELREHYPNDELVLLIGSDIARGLVSQWPGIKTLLQQLHLAIGLRREDGREEVEALMLRLEEAYTVGPGYISIVSPRPHAASAKVRASLSPDDVDPKVATYISRHNLY